MSKPVILTGLRANNDLHIGNYFGALLPMIDMARERAGEFQINLFVPDLHSFTTPIDHSELQGQIMRNLKLFVAAGLPLDDPDIHIYRQSYVPAHSELTWILDCFTGFGEMSRMTQLKDKTKLTDQETKEIEELHKVMSNKFAIESPRSLYTIADQASKRKEDSPIYRGIVSTYREQKEVSVGLFNYPVLMAADILLYDALYVPVGDDQSQHLEFTRDIATRMNSKFAGRFPDGLFTVPRPVPAQHEFFGKDQGLRIRDLQAPGKKMSKSDETGKGIIFLGDDPAQAAKKIMSAETDSVGAIHFDWEKQPGVTNLLQILALLGGQPLHDVQKAWEGKPSYGELKNAVAPAVQTFLADFQTKLAAVDEAALQAKLKQSEQAMNEKASATLLKTQQAVGLRA